MRSCSSTRARMSRGTPPRLIRPRADAAARVRTSTPQTLSTDLPLEILLAYLEREEVTRGWRLKQPDRSVVRDLAARWRTWCALCPRKVGAACLSGESSAGQVLARCLPVLFAHLAPFKVAASLEGAASTQLGLARAQPNGKFLTAYPRDDQHAVSIALALDRATRGLRGPRVPSDRRLSTDGLVHYRYGSFVISSCRRLLATSCPQSGTRTARRGGPLAVDVSPNPSI